MTALARRREAECVSDLRLDRWLLGETPGSDEARQLERHIAECTECASRLRSLRSLYSAAHVETTVPERPARVAAAGLLQVIILRDGLLVGTEMFTSGEWRIGSGDTDLALDSLRQRHARLRFHEGRAWVEAEQGSVYVNGNRVERHELRPIDEVCVGPWLLRARLVNERWVRPAATPLRAVAPLPADEKTEIVERPTPEVLSVKLRWGDQVIAAHTFEAHQAVPADLFETLGAEPLRVQPEGGYRRVFWGAATPPEGELVGPNAPLELKHGGLTLDAAMVEREQRVSRGPVRVPRLVVLLTVLFGVVPVGLGLIDAPDDDHFETRSIQRPLHPTPPAPPTPPTPPDSNATKRPSAPIAAAPHQPKTPARHPRTPPSLPSQLTDSLKGFDSAFRAFEAKLRHQTPGHPRGKTVAVAGLPSGVAGAGLPALGGGGLSPVGIGAAGIGAAGVLPAGRTGKGSVIASVNGPPRIVGASGASGATIDRDAVADVVQAHASEVAACYEAALLRYDGLRGTAKLEWHIDPSGTVTSVRLVGATLRDSGVVTSCVMTKLKTWRFPKARGGEVVVTNNFVFRDSTY